MGGYLLQLLSFGWLCSRLDRVKIQTIDLTIDAHPCMQVFDGA